MCPFRLVFPKIMTNQFLRKVEPLCQFMESFLIKYFSPSTIVHRDFHIDNLVLLDGEPGISACGLLDFQDALIGSGIYDLMSLLEDARRDVTKVLQSELKNKYFCEIQELGIFRAPYAVFETNFAILAANRHAKVLGVFSRLATRDNEGYRITFRAFGTLEAALNPKLAGLRFWFDNIFQKARDPFEYLTGIT